MSKTEKTGPLFLLCTAVLWSLAGVLTKSVAWNGVSLSCMRGLIAFCVFRLVSGRVRIRLTRQSIAMAFCYFAQGLLFISANKFTTAGNATVLQNTSPLYIILLNMLIFKQKPMLRDILAGGALFCGVVLAFFGSLGGGIVGNILALISALFYAGVFFLGRTPGADALESVMLGNLMYMLLFLFCFLDRAFMHPDLRSWLCALAFGVLSGGFGWLLFARGIKTTPALTASFLTMLEPVLSPVWALLFLREKLGPLSLAGGALVIGTLIVYNTLSIRKSAPPKEG